jgi:hypothetical protein
MCRDSSCTSNNRAPSPPLYTIHPQPIQGVAESLLPDPKGVGGDSPRGGAGVVVDTPPGLKEGRCRHKAPAYHTDSHTAMRNSATSG